MCIEYQSAIQANCGSCLLRHGLHFSTDVDDAIDQWRKRLEACVHDSVQNNTGPSGVIAEDA